MATRMMLQPRAEQLADLLWRMLRPQAVAMLDAALAVQSDGMPADELTAEDVARLDALIARRTRRQRDRKNAQHKQEPKRRSTSTARGAS